MESTNVILGMTQVIRAWANAPSNNAVEAAS
jgi:hypothetical protein